MDRLSGELLELRAISVEDKSVNSQLEAQLQAVRAQVIERERAIDAIAADASNVSNIDQAELQRRHRMLAAAYRTDRRRAEQMSAQAARLPSHAHQTGTVHSPDGQQCVTGRVCSRAGGAVHQHGRCGPRALVPTGALCV